MARDNSREFAEQYARDRAAYLSPLQLIMWIGRNRAADHYRSSYGRHESELMGPAARAQYFNADPRVQVLKLERELRGRGVLGPKETLKRKRQQAAVDARRQGYRD